MRYNLFWLAPTLCAIAVTLCFLSLGTDKWYNSAYLYSGLWKGCYYNHGNQTWQCMDVKADAKLNAVRSFVIISIGLSLGTVVLAVSAYIKESAALSTAAAILTATQTVMMVVALCVYFTSIATAAEPYTISNLSWSYATGWAGVAFYSTTAAAFAIQAYALRRTAHHGYSTIN